MVDDSDPDTDLDQLAHAVQTAEASRRAYPGDEYDWLHVTGFIHDLGKIMAVKEKGFSGAWRGVCVALRGVAWRGVAWRDVRGVSLPPWRGALSAARVGANGIVGRPT